MEASRPPGVVGFGPYEIRLRTQELFKQGLRLKLPPQAFHVLRILLERHGELVTREELRQALWPADTFVDFDHGLNSAIKKIRDVLNDSVERPCYVETMPRLGYRFIAPVESVAAIPDHKNSGGEAGAALESKSVEAEERGSTPAPAVQHDPGGAGSRYQTRRLKPAMFLLLGLLVLGAWLIWHRLARQQVYHPAATVSSAPVRSLAVLPLQNLSGEKDQEFFADGMTDELITDLGQISALRVISRTTAMHYKGTPKMLPQIGRELDVDAIVEGAVFRFGDRVRITVQLIDSRTDRHLWAHGYERDLRDVLGLQDEVARDIANEIRVKLTPQEQARLAGSHAVNPEAHEAYLKGLHYWNQFTEPGVKKSREYFQQAIEKDPTYALGYSGLSDYYSVMYVRFDALPRNEACPKSETLALKAIEIDDSLAEPHLALAGTRLFCRWDWQSAESELKRAIQLNPSYAEAHGLYAILLKLCGRVEEALGEMNRAVENDPMSVVFTERLGWVYYAMRHFDQAIQEYRKLLESGPAWAAGAHNGLGDVYVQKGQLDAAIREYRKAIELSGKDAWPLPGLGYAYALAGKRREALQVLKELNATSEHRPVGALGRAAVYIGLGDKEQAFAWLEKAYEQHEKDMLNLKVEPQYDSLRSDPRFQDLLRRMNFPQ